MSGKVKVRGEESRQQHFVRAELCRLQFSQVSDGLFALFFSVVVLGSVGNPLRPFQAPERDGESHAEQPPLPPTPTPVPQCRAELQAVKRQGNSRRVKVMDN